MTLRVDRIENQAGSSGVDTDYVVQGSAKVRANANMATPAMRESFNVSSLVDNATGQSLFNFTNALSTSDYCAVVGTGSNGASDYADTVKYAVPSVTTINVNVANASNGYVDRAYVTCCLFGELA